MTSLSKKILFLLILISTFSFAQKVDKIEIESKKNFSDSELLRWAGLNEGQNYFPGILDSSLSRISTELGYNGYFYPVTSNSLVEFSTDSQNVTLHLNIDEGEPTIVKDVIFSSPDSMDIENYILPFNYLKGEIFNQYEIEND